MILSLLLALQVTASADTGAFAPLPLTMQDVDLHRKGRLALDLFYPERAQRLGISGEAIATCRIVEGGMLKACTIVSATPTGENFDLAAAKLLDNAKIDASTKSGEPTAGRTLNLTLKFVSRGLDNFRIRFE